MTELFVIIISLNLSHKTVRVQRYALLHCNMHTYWKCYFLHMLLAGLTSSYSTQQCAKLLFCISHYLIWFLLMTPRKLQILATGITGANYFHKSH